MRGNINKRQEISCCARTTLWQPSSPSLTRHPNPIPALKHHHLNGYWNQANFLLFSRMNRTPAAFSLSLSTLLLSTRLHEDRFLYQQGMTVEAGSQSHVAPLNRETLVCTRGSRG